MKIDSCTEKFDVHNTSYDVELDSFDKWPTSIVVEPEGRFVCVSLHKWCTSDGQNRGYYIALLKVCEDGATSPRDLVAHKIQLVRTMHKEYAHSLIASIEDGTVDCDGLELVYFRWCINVWRKVCKKKRKWEYTCERPPKDSLCPIQRVLYT